MQVETTLGAFPRETEQREQAVSSPPGHEFTILSVLCSTVSGHGDRKYIPRLSHRACNTHLTLSLTVTQHT